VINWVKAGAIAGFATLAGLIATPALGATVSASGGTFDGWLITPAKGITLTADASNAADLALTKQADFPALGGLVISFTQVSGNAASAVTIDNETVTNSTGADWGGFQFLLIDVDGSAAFTDAASDLFAPPKGYTGASFSPTNLVYTGTQANAAVSNWGSTSAQLRIDAAPAGIGTTFDLEEIPLNASQVADASTGGDPVQFPTVVVPLPTASRMGMFALAGLAVLAYLNSLRKIISRRATASRHESH
jgi:hypothetical protein